MRQLETLQTVATLRLLSDHVQDRVHKLSPLCVVALGPVVPRAALAEHEVIGTEDLSEGAGPDAVHGPWLEVYQHCAGDVLSAGSFVVVDVDSLQLQVGVPVVGAGGVDAVLVGNNLPKLGPDLVAALAGLQVNYFSHDK